jgi:hypothetical protein
MRRMMRDHRCLAVKFFREAFFQPPAMIHMDLRGLHRCEVLVARFGDPNVMIVIHVIGGTLNVCESIAIDLKICPQCAAQKAIPPEEKIGLLEKSGAMCGSHILHLVFAINVTILVVVVSRQRKDLSVWKQLCQPR